MYDELEHACRAISGKHFWGEGWIAVRRTIHFDSKGFTPEVSAQLASMEELLRPTDLVQKIRSVVLSNGLIGVELDLWDDNRDDIPAGIERIEAIAQGLGQAVAADEQVFGDLLAELVSSEGRLWSFGRGLAGGAKDPSALWKQLVTQLADTAEGQRKVQILCGFLHAMHARSPEVANLFLDDALQHAILAPWYPILQIAVGIDRQGVDRLKRSLVLGKAPIWIYRNLAAGRVTDPISGKDFKEPVLEIAAKPDGLDAASDIVYMRLHSAEGQKQSLAPEIIDAGCELLRHLKFTKQNGHNDYMLGAICKSCLIGATDTAIAQQICRKLADSISKYETYALYYGDLL